MKKIWILTNLILTLLILTSCQDFLSYELADYEIKDIPITVSLNHDNSDLTIEELINQLSLDIMPSNVTVHASIYTSFGPFRTNETNYFGSGVIFYENDVFYYVLTNEHVIAKNEDGESASYKITDYKNNSHKAYLYESSDDDSVDLAVLYFEKDQHTYPVIEMNETPLNIDDKIIAVGQPEGQKNTITFGEVTLFTQTNVTNRFDEEILREFLAIQHTAYVNSGSSGGMLLDYNLTLVGINFAGAESDGKHQFTYAIPMSIILEYFNQLFIDDFE
ncbi:MAG: serine protease [Bacillota bacterium]|nr:MAG: serine protease [Bacillota bacterium]